MLLAGWRNGAHRRQGAARRGGATLAIFQAASAARRVPCSCSPRPAVQAGAGGAWGGAAWETGFAVDVAGQE